jgi:hypothetical protein
VTTVSSMAGGSGGAAAGFAIGTTIMPGVGSIVGTIVGGKCLFINILMSRAHRRIRWREDKC